MSKPDRSIQLDAFQAQLEADKGMLKSILTTSRQTPNWSVAAFIFLNGRYRNSIGGSAHGIHFMTEDVRKAAENILPAPSSQRAWGFIMKQAAKQKVIEHVGYQKVRNKKAHATPASVWKFK